GFGSLRREPAEVGAAVQPRPRADRGWTAASTAGAAARGWTAAPTAAAADRGRPAAPTAGAADRGWTAAPTAAALTSVGSRLQLCRDALRFTPHAQQIAAPDFVDVLGAVAAPLELCRDVRRLRRAGPAEH